MTASRAERLMNLHILLLGSRRFLDKATIRRACYPDHPDTPAGEEAFERSFERDKDALRAIGAVIEVGSADSYFDDELGYRIPNEQTSLPEVRLEADEAALVGLAAQVWQEATLAKATSRALAKLKAQGADLDPSRLEVIAPAIRADEPAFEPLWDAVQRRREVSFDYHRAASTTATRRKVQPWGLVRTSGRWYLVGHDLDRGAERVFRLSRIAGRVRASGKSGSYAVPPDTDVRALSMRQGATNDLQVEAEVHVRPGSGVGLRRRALEVVAGAVTGPDGEPWDRIVLAGSGDALADEVLSYGPDVRVASPTELVDIVVERLRRALSEVDA